MTKKFEVLNRTRDKDAHRQVCELLTEDSKNLETATELKTVAGDGKSEIVDYAWKLKKRGLADITIKQRCYWLQRLTLKGADLKNTDSVETVLATENFKSGTKAEIVRAYRSYTKTFNILWTPIKVNHETKQPFIPLRQELETLISGCGKRTATYLQVLMDTGARAGETAKLKWTDVNAENSTIAINKPEKHSNSRTVKVSARTIAMINALPKKYGEYIFNPNPAALQEGFRRSRNRLAQTLHNPRLRQIHFHTFRHFKATMEYHRTRDILYVKNILGHKRIENTEIYTHLIEFENDEYTCSVAKNIEEAKQLIETGFEYVTEMDDSKLFRKRK
jgi:integrase